MKIKKFKPKDLLIAIVIVAVGVLATVLFRLNYTDEGSPYEDQLPVSEFSRLVNSNDSRVWFYVYNKHEQKYAGLQDDDAIERIYIAKSGKAVVYKDADSNIPRISDFAGLSPTAIVQKIESNQIPGHNFVKQDTEYNFLALPDSTYTDVNISIEPVSGVQNDYSFIQTVPASEIVTDMRVNTLVFAGYYHQSSSADRFVKYQSLGLITPIE